MLVYVPDMEDIVIIGNPNKAPDSARELLAAGFTWAISPAHYSCTDINLTGTYDPVCCGQRHSCNTRENNLRSAWAAMLKDYADAPEETIFGEADITPSPGVTRDYLRRFVQHPYIRMFDIVCLFNNAREAPAVKLPEPGCKSIFDLRWAVKHADAGDFGPLFTDNDKWGTHAIWIQPKVRKVLEYLFRDLNAPTDSAVVHAAVKGILRVGKLYSNMFYQAEHIKDPLMY